MSKVNGYGHNGAPVYETRSDLPDDVPPLDWFKCNARQFLDDLLRLPLDERGFYASAVMVMYAEMETLPADDRMAAHRLAMDVRSYRAFLKKLMDRKSATSEVPLLYKRQSGRISNHRYDEEITAYVELVKKRKEAASERELKRKSAKTGAVNADTSPGDVRGMSRGSGDIPRTSLGHSGSIVGSIVDGSSGKTEQNQECDMQRTGTPLPVLCQSSATEREREGERERKGVPHTPPTGGNDLPLILEEPPQPETDDVDADFEQFWKSFPPGRKVDKGKAASTFRKIVTRKHRDKRLHATAKEVIAAVERYARTRPDPNYTPMPTTWLNGGRWMDIPEDQPNGHDTDSLAESLELARLAFEEAESRQWQS